MNEIIAYDAAHPCSYLPEEVARLPMRFQRAMLTPEEFDACLAAGDRRSGRLLYRTACPACRACEPIRLDLAAWEPSQTQRREQRKGNVQLTVKIGEPAIDHRRLALYHRHQTGRGLSDAEEPLDEEAYREFLANTCCRTLELAYYHGEELVGVAIADAGRTSLSAVYCYYNPAFRGVSLGTYSVLRQADYCREHGLRYLYLGFYIAQSSRMSYKARFHPHQRLLGGVWRDFA